MLVKEAQKQQKQIGLVAVYRSKQFATMKNWVCSRHRIEQKGDLDYST